MLRVPVYPASHGTHGQDPNRHRNDIDSAALSPGSFFSAAHSASPGTMGSANSNAWTRRLLETPARTASSADAGQPRASAPLDSSAYRFTASPDSLAAKPTPYEGNDQAGAAI